MRVDGPWIHRSGQGAGPAGARPFLDRQNLETLKSERLWQCEERTYESVAALIDVTASGPVFMTRCETASKPPNYRLHSGEKVQALTDYADPTPQLRGITKQLVTYERADGVALSSILYLPAGYEEGTRLPLVVWAYPREFSDPKTAGQVGGSPHRFTRIGGSSHLFFLTQGYAIMDAATMPVIGDAETMNDTFIDQIVAAAQAAIDKAVEMGVADPTRVGVGGHSYGAFMTANLLAHCDLFSAGVARSGAYNRTLTPFGFQSERRTLWEAPEIYFAISPFMHANKINADPAPARRDRQQLRYLPGAVVTAVPGHQGQRRDSEAGLPAQREPWVSRPRVGASHAGRDDRLVRQAREECQSQALKQ